MTYRRAANGNGNELYIPESYYEFASLFGQVIPITPDMPVIKNLDLVILPGGADLSQAVRNGDEKFSLSVGSDNPAYTYFYKNSLQKWIEAKVPMFGICLGFQGLLNHLGEYLEPDMENHSFGTDKMVHSTVLVAGNILFSEEETKMLMEEEMPSTDSKNFMGMNDLVKSPMPLSVNSRHHQGFRYSNMKQENKSSAISLDSQGEVLEAFFDPTKKLGGVQWHPEDLSNLRAETFDISTKYLDVVSLKIIHALLNGK